MSYEILGLVASILVLISFLFNKERNIRVINIIGAICFVIYGIKIGALSVWILNSALVIIHLWKLNTTL